MLFKFAMEQIYANVSELGYKSAFLGAGTYL